MWRRAIFNYLLLLILFLITAQADNSQKDLTDFIAKTTTQTQPSVIAPHFSELSLYNNSAVSSDPFSIKNESAALPIHTSLRQEIIPIHYMNLDALAHMLNEKSANFLSANGHLLADNAHNLIYLEDTQENLKRIERFITLIDVPEKQILIRAQIAIVDDHFMRSLGATFKMHDSNSTATSDNFTFPMVKFMNGAVLDLEISASENAGHARLISSPQLITLNHLPALIESGEEIPYQQTTYSGGTSVIFKKAVLRLKVTPQVLPRQQILLQVWVNQDKVSPLIVHGEPAISTQQLQTQVILKNKQTVALGGIYQEEFSKQRTGIPLLNQLPAVGTLFNKNSHTNNRRQLLVFITPQILNP